MGFGRDFTKPSLTTVEEWTSVLNLAAKFQFKSIRNLAISHLSTIASPIDKIVLGRKHTIVDWLSYGYRSTCERNEMLTMQEMERLDKKDLLKMANLWISRPSGKISDEEVSKMFDLDKYRPPVQESAKVEEVVEEEPKPKKKKAPVLTKAQQKKKKQQEEKEAKETADREFEEQQEKEKVVREFEEQLEKEKVVRELQEQLEKEKAARELQEQLEKELAAKAEREDDVRVNYGR